MARRVNTRFLTILTLVVLGGLVAAFVATKLFTRRGDPAKFESQGDALVQQGDERKKEADGLARAREYDKERQTLEQAWEYYGQARQYYQQAFQLRPTNANVLVKLGKVWSELARKDPVYGGQDVGCWRRAMELDPGNQEALQALLRLHWAIAQQPQFNSVEWTKSRISILGSIKEYSQQLARLNPNDRSAAAKQHYATVLEWRGRGTQVTDDQVKQAYDALAKLWQAEATDSELGWFVAQIPLYWAEDARLQGKWAEVSKKVDEAWAAFQPGLAAEPESATMHYYAYRIAAWAADLLKQVPGQDPEAKPSADPGQYLQRAGEQIGLAKQHLKTSDPESMAVEIYLRAAVAARESGNPQAEALHREALAKWPDDLRVRAALAQMLTQNRARLAEAITVLDAPYPAGPRQWSNQIASTLEASILRLEQYPTLATPTERSALLERVRRDVQQAEKDLAEKPSSVAMELSQLQLTQLRLLQVRGRLELLDGNWVKAIQTLTLADQGLRQRGLTDTRLQLQLVQAYLGAEQTGEAERLLGQIVAVAKNSPGPRLKLAQLLMARNARKEAEQHLLVLEKQLPDSPDVLALKIQTLDGQKDKEQIQALYARLPEQEVAQRLVKANLARALGQSDEAIRLLEAVLKDDAGNKQGVLTLAQIYLETNQTPKAVAVVAAARKVDPADGQLRRWEERLAGKTPQQILADEPDALTRELGLAELAWQEKPEEAYEHLKNAEKVKADYIPTLERLFNWHLQQKQWQQATEYAEKLKNDPQDASGGLLAQYRLALAKRETDRAIDFARQLVDKLPELSRSWLVYGQALHAAGRYEEALSKYQEALNREVNNSEVRRGIIACYYSLNRTTDVGKFIDEQRQQFPADAYLVNQFIGWNLSYGSPDKALPALEYSLKATPEDPKAYLDLGRAYEIARDRMVAQESTAKASDYLNKARETFVRATQKWPDGPEKWPNRLEFYRHLAIIEVQSKQPDRAVTVVEQLSARPAFKDSPEPWLMLAELYRNLNRPAERETALRAALKRSNNSPEIQVMLAGSLVEQKRIDEALKALETNAELPIVRIQRVEILIGAERWQEAEAIIRQQLASQPDSSLWLSMLGTFHLSNERPDLAEPALDQAIAKDPKSFAARYQRGVLRLKKPTPDLTGAAEDLEAARSANPAHLATRRALAQVWYGQQRTDEAVRELEAVVSAAPAWREVRTDLVGWYANARPQPRWADAERVLRQGLDNLALAGDPELLRQLAWVYGQQQRAPEAIRAITQAYQAAPGNEQVARSYLDLLLAAKQDQTVMQEIDKLLQQHQDWWWLLTARATAKHDLKDYAGAVSDHQAALTSKAAQEDARVAQMIVWSLAGVDLDQAISIALPRAQQDTTWQLLLAQLYVRNGNPAQGRIVIEKVLADRSRLEPGIRQQALRVAGNLYMSPPAPNYEKSQQSYTDLLAEAPQDREALNNLACVLAEGVNPPRPAQAKIYSTKAYEQMQKEQRFDPIVVDTHGWVLALCGEMQPAIDLLRQVVVRSPIPDAHYHLAEAYVRNEQPKLAERQIEAARQLIAAIEEKGGRVDPELKRKVEALGEKLKQATSQVDGK